MECKVFQSKTNSRGRLGKVTVGLGVHDDILDRGPNFPAYHHDSRVVTVCQQLQMCVVFLVPSLD